MPRPRQPSRHLSPRATAALSCLLACSGTIACTTAPGDEDADTSVVEPGELDGACPLNERVGLFSVVHEADYSAVDGEINEAVIPATIVQETLAAGGCQLLTRDNPFCDPACGTGEACTHAGSCIPYPERQDTGTVTIDGLAVGVVMQPRADKRYFETTLPHPVFSPGTAIRLTSSGGEVGPLELSGRGFAPIELAKSAWIAQPGQPLIVNWVAEDDGEARFYLTINVDQHGISPSTLVCEGPDTGSFEVPATMIDALLDAGISGFPTGHAYRRTVDSTITDNGCVELQVRSHRDATLEVAGHTPCTATPDCPDGQTCDIPNQTCV
ncbi:hypothetical protein DB30_00005 [Enhygromyxa salina]|uniref:Lipoprotein n=1 Tax=Enhygromyxa salina TaxID=215803 RepID=A0A0C2D8U4_9BACT|nr:hypothetical protein [Enhygromyxa salina]KIG19496.1 hypothetical protein DB30_00005 [Enhygromyxa salina]